MYKQCRECNFYIQESEDYCPNCGIIEPQYGKSNRELLENIEKDRKERNLEMDNKRREIQQGHNTTTEKLITLYENKFGIFFLILVVILGVIAYFILANSTLKLEKWDLILLSPAFLLVTFFFTGLLGYYIYNLIGNRISIFLDKKLTLKIGELKSIFEENKMIEEQNQKKQEYYLFCTNTSYQERERLIDQQLKNTIAKINALESLIKENESQINQSNSEEAKSRLSRLKKGLKIHQEKQENYLIEQWDIWLRKWKNQLDGLRYGDRSIKNLEKIEQEGIITLEEWKKQSLSSGAKYIQFLDKTLETCQGIRESLKDEEAANPLKDVTILENSAFNLPAWEDLFSTLDILNDLPDAGAFSSGFEALEKETIEV